MMTSIKTLLLVKHSKTGNTQLLCDAFLEGARRVSNIRVRIVDALHGVPSDLMECSALVLATPENFGTMSGGMKHFFDQTYYEVEALQLALPYQLIISAGNDGTGAEREMQRILTGYKFRQIGTALIVRGRPLGPDLDAAEELGESVATALELGII
ncbi:NAD(P)H-dependent oxidoreductase [uncultured Umboniibacter sp.]|uniref:flavodoxin family protein n=1 Tax=uncultured Umboniibacter sp. TaxID=1798917 RepID=UPI002615756B|nr:NAD(P)H-dependent oxidoreductase [uncultured Umboniibacter sp.]